MLQWITVISFAIGIVVACCFELPWFWLLIAFVPGLLMLIAQFWRKGNPWIGLVWNVVLLGAMWCTLRQQMHESKTDGDSPSLVASISQKTSAFTRDCLLESGLTEDDAAVLNAMLLGDRKGLTQEQKQHFRGAGAQHLLALSGLHLGIFIAILSFLFLRRARFSRWKWPVLLATLLLLWSYCLMAGMPQSLLRAMLMTTLFYFCLFSTSRAQSNVTLANTLLLMLLIDPLSLFDIGTQLSFSAVGALIWLCPVVSNIFPASTFLPNRFGRLLHRVWQLTAVSLSAWFGTMPLCLFYFHQFQPWQPLASIILVPMTTVLLYFGFFLLLFGACGISFIACVLGVCISWLMKVENAILDMAGALPFSTVKVTGIHLGHVLLLYALIFVMGVGLQAPRKVQWYCLLEVFGILVLLCLI